MSCTLTNEISKAKANAKKNSLFTNDETCKLQPLLLNSNSKPFSARLQEWFIVLQDVFIFILYSCFMNLITFFQLIFPPTPKSLNGEIILITGSASGIGREICLKLGNIGKENITLICWDIQDYKNKILVEDLKDIGCGSVYSYNVDIGDRNQVELAAAKVKREIGAITMIINNAGIMPCHSFLSHNPKEIERAFQVNVLSHFWILREFLPGMIEQNNGHIVTVCSAAGIIPVRYLVPYCATKHAVNGYIEALKDELIHDPKKPNIKFTTVYPFTCKTNLIRNIKCYTRFPSLFPVLEPEQVAEKLIDGLRRNYEHVYVPSLIQIVSIFTRILSTKVQIAGAKLVQCFVEPELL